MLLRAGRACLAALLAVCLLAGCEPEPGPTAIATDPAIQDGALNTSIKGHPFTLELALSADQRHRGLSDRRSMPADHGMLFVFPYPREASFVMRRCYFPIDLIYLDRDGKVVRVHRMAVEPPEIRADDAKLRGYPSGQPVQFAIELNGGWLDRLNLKRGEVIDLPLGDLKAMAQ